MTLLARDAGLELDHDVTRVVAQLFLPGETVIQKFREEKNVTNN